jgi:uncharacterized NAD(P)/FAD-binding protein YdhS
LATARKIAIIGGGASGTVLAAHLLRDASSPLSIMVVEPRAATGFGIAYSTPFVSHLLNVRAGDMSAFRDTPGHFVEWLRANVQADAASDCYATRERYGLYLQATLADALRRARSKVVFEHVRAAAVGLHLQPDGFEIETDTGRAICADRVVLALGNSPAGLPRQLEGVPALSAWLPDVVRDLRRDATVLLIGSGLTAVDVCLALNETGHSGPIYAVSRRGLLPQVHAQNSVHVILKREDLPEASVPALLRRIRRLSRRHLETGGTWQGIVGGLRPLTQEIWRALPLEEKRRFLRHARPFWDVHRHQMAPEVHLTMEEMRLRGQLRVVAGRIVSASEVGTATNVRVVQRRSFAEITIAADYLINCTGPESDARQLKIPLQKQLVADELARYDPLFLGIDTTEDGALIKNDGAILEGVFAIGPLLKGVLWETIAMPEISAQAADLAHRLLASE